MVYLLNKKLYSTVIMQTGTKVHILSRIVIKYMIIQYCNRVGDLLDDATTIVSFRLDY